MVGSDRLAVSFMSHAQCWLPAGEWGVGNKSQGLPALDTSQEEIKSPRRVTGRMCDDQSPHSI